MDSSDLIDAALRVLSAIDHGRQPADDDLQILKSNAQPEEMALPVSELAGEIIAREIAKRRVLRAKH